MSNLRHRAAGTPVIIVAIDDKSLNSIGDWPWPRSYIADIIDTLSKNGAHTQGVSILFRSKELNDGLVEIQNFRENIHQKPPIGKKQTLNKIDLLMSFINRSLNYIYEVGGRVFSRVLGITVRYDWPINKILQVSGLCGIIFCSSPEQVQVGYKK
jgi:hypothetical protein